MTSSISRATSAPTPALAASVNATKEAQAKAPSAKPEPVAKTTVTISSAAISALAAQKSEAIETPAQTAQEARGNDRQAQRLLARQEAAKSAHL